MDLAQATYLQAELRSQLWQRGAVSEWYLKPKQKLVHDFMRATEDPFFEASRRYGKTTTVLNYVCEESVLHAGHITRWCEPWKNQCREIVMTEMDQLQSHIPKRYRFRWNQTDSYYVCRWNDSRIYLRGVNEDKGESARGSKAHIVVCDELGSWRHPQYVIAEVLGPQLLTTKGKVIYLGTPPRNFTHHYYDLKDKAILDGRFIQRVIHDQEITDWEQVEKAVARAGGWGSPGVDREYLCKKTIDKNFSITPEWNDKYIEDVPRDEYFRFYFKYDSLDIGVRDLTVCLLAYYDFRKSCLVIVDEIVMNGPEMTTEKLAEAIRPKEAEHFQVKWHETKDGSRVRWQIIAPPHFHLRRVSDVDLLLVNDMSLLHGLYFAPTDKGGLEEMVNELRVWLGAGRIRVHPRCVTLIDSLRYGLWDEKRKDWERSDRLGHFDALAALMYLVRNVDYRTNPIPPDHGRSAENHFYVEDQKQDRREKLRRALNVR